MATPSSPCGYSLPLIVVSLICFDVLHPHSSRPVSAVLTSSNPALAAVTGTSSTSSVTSSFFELHKSRPTSASLLVGDRSSLGHGLLPWSSQQHPASCLNPAAFLEYLRLINLRHNIDTVAHHLAAERAEAWPAAVAAELSGTPSRSDADHVVRPCIVRPIPLKKVSTPT